MPWIFYNDAKRWMVIGSISLGVDPINIMLLSDTYTPDIDVHESRADVLAHEASGTGYTAGGQALASITTIRDDTNDRILWGADDPQWTNITITFRYAVLYKNNFSIASGDQLICYHDFGTNQSITNGTLNIVLPITGIATIN